MCAYRFFCFKRSVRCGSSVSAGDKFSVGLLTENLVNVIGEGDTELPRDIGLGRVAAELGGQARARQRMPVGIDAAGG